MTGSPTGLDRLRAMLAEPGVARRIVAVAGAPGSGKSTVTDALVAQLNASRPGVAAVLPMDGYHYDDRVLDERDLRARKGAPDTFDVAGLRHVLGRLHADGEDEVAVPVFDRDLEISRAAARILPRTVRVVVVEGNYLLLDREPWSSLRPFFDATVMVDVPVETLRQRLIARWEGYGLPLEEIRRKVEENDLPNGRLVTEHSTAADHVLRAVTDPRPAHPGHLDAPSDSYPNPVPSMPELNDLTLTSLPSTVMRPGYDRRAVRAGIAHIGVGNFHRTHQAVYVDRCLHLPGHESWGIVGIGLTDSSSGREKVEAYGRQDGLYTVTEYGPDGRGSTRVIGAMIDYLHAPKDPKRVLAVLASPHIRIVTLTITEGGYNIDERTGEFRLDDPEVARDLKSEIPSTVFGYLVEALTRRRAAGVPAFAVVSCDNLRHNGDTTRKAVVSFAKARDPDLAAWIDREGTFPNGMVDRIAPSVSTEDRRRLVAESGVDDEVPAMGESFTQWVIEDRFPNGRPNLGAVGVELRDDVALFEAAKGRILNASHVMMAYPALLCGYRLVHDAMADRRLRGFILRFLSLDAIPLIEGPPGVDLQYYAEIILERFSNPAVGDQLLRIAQNGAAKIPVFHRKTLESLAASGGHLAREAFFLACFARYFDGVDDMGATYDVVEPTFTKADREALRSPDGLGLLRTSPFAALGLDRHAEFASAYRAAAAALSADGVGKALEADGGRTW